MMITSAASRASRSPDLPFDPRKPDDQHIAPEWCEPSPAWCTEFCLVFASALFVDSLFAQSACERALEVVAANPE